MDSICRTVFATDDEGHGVGANFVGGPYGRVGRDLRICREFCVIVTVDPVAVIAGLRGRRGQVGDRVKGIVRHDDRIDRVAVFVDEGDRVGDVFILGRNAHIGLDDGLPVEYIGRALDDPPAALAFARFRRRQSAAHRGALFDFLDILDLIVAVVEGDRPVHGLIGGFHGHVAGHHGFGGDFLLRGRVDPLAVGVAVLFGYVDHLIADGSARVDLDGLLQVAVHHEADVELLHEHGVEGDLAFLDLRKVVREGDKLFARFGKAPAYEAVTRFGGVAGRSVVSHPFGFFVQEVLMPFGDELDVDQRSFQVAKQRQLRSARGVGLRITALGKDAKRQRVDDQKRCQQDGGEFSECSCHTTIPFL